MQDDTYQYPCYGGNGLRGYVCYYNREGRYPLIGRQGALCGNINVADGKFYATEHAVIVDTYSETNINWTINALLYLNLNQYATSTAQPGLSVGTINDVLIPIPPLEEQKRISQSLYNWFALIDIIEQEKADLQTAINQAKNKILKLAIHGKLVPQDLNDEPASELLKRINPNAKITTDNMHDRKLPQGWYPCKIKDIATSLLGKTLDRSKNVGEFKKYLCAINVKWGEFDFATMKKLQIEDTEFERYAVKHGDLLVCEGGDVGRAAIWNYEHEMYYQNALHRIRFKEGISAYYFFYSLMYLKFTGVIDDACKGVTIKHFTQDVMNSLLFYLPPLAEQRRIVAKINEIFSYLDMIKSSLQA